MDRYTLPRRHRPEGGYVRTPIPGLDLPAGFLDDIHAIDPRLWVIHHPFRVEWDPTMNCYSGSIEDPRFNIHIEDEKYGKTELWGWVLLNPDNSPIEDDSWHIWQESPVGYHHVCQIASTDPDYLKLLAYRLHLQGRLVDVYGKKVYARKLSEEFRERQEKEKAELREYEMAVHKENDWLLKKAIDNMERGKINPTNPQKESIVSYSGQGYRSRVSRPLEDHEGGIVTP